MRDKAPNTATILDNAAAVIGAFGGIRPMAKKLGVAVTTVQGWKERGVIPFARLDEIKAAAQRENIDLEKLPTARAAAQPVAAEKVTSKPDIGVSAAETKTPASETLDATPTAPPTSKTDSNPTSRTTTADTAGPAKKKSMTEETPQSTPAATKGTRRQTTRSRPWFRFGLGLGLAVILGAVAGYFLGPKLMSLFGPQSATVSADTAARLGRLEAALKAEQGKQQNTINSLSGKINRLTSDLAAARRAADAAGKALAEMRKAPATPGATAAAVKNLASRVDKLDAAAKTAAAANGALSAFRKQLTAFETRLATAEKNAQTATKAPTVDPAVAKVNADAIRAMRQQIATLDARIKADQKIFRDQQISLQALLKTQQAELKTLRAKVADTPRAVKAAPLMLAVGQLRQAIDSSAPYGGALSSVKALAADRPAWVKPLAVLQSYAQTGVKTHADLRRDFDDQTTGLLRAARIAESDGWLDRAWARLRSTISVRRTGSKVAGKTPEALVARVETALKAHDLAKALQIVGQFPKPAQQKIAGWMVAAKARLAVDTALGQINTQAIKKLTSSSPAPAAKPADGKQ